MEVAPHEEEALVSTRVHAKTDLAEWQEGETRQVYARYKDDPGRLYFLDDDTVLELRGWLKEHVECFMPECTNRELIPRAGSKGRRDHFGHHSGAGGHGEESLAHEQAKQVLRSWLEQQDAVLEAQTEWPFGRQAKADVYASDGDFELVFEVQYSSLAPSEWKRRHAVYDTCCIGDLWVWGHRGKHLQFDPRTQTVRLSNAQLEAVAAGQPLIWLNPERREVLTGWVFKHVAMYVNSDQLGKKAAQRDAQRSFQVPPTVADERCWVTVDALDDCTLDGWGILTPTRQKLQQQQAELDQIVEERRLQVQRRTEQERQRRAHMATPELREEAWQQDPRRQQLLDTFGEIPPVLRGDNSTVAGVWAHPEQWRATLYLELVHSASHGHRFAFEDCYGTLREAGIAMDSPGTEFADFLRHLDREGLIRVVSQRDRILEVWVRHPIPGPEQKAAEEPTSEPTETAAASTPQPMETTTSPSGPTVAQHRSYPVPTEPPPLAPPVAQPAVKRQRGGLLRWLLPWRR